MRKILILASLILTSCVHEPKNDEVIFSSDKEKIAAPDRDQLPDSIQVEGGTIFIDPSGGIRIMVNDSIAKDSTQLE